MDSSVDREAGRAADEDRFERALARIDAVHAQDPESELAAGVREPRELLYARHMTDMLRRFAPDASEALKLAVRCQHIRRWEIPRASYPPTPAGYKAWRAQLLVRQAEVASEILRETGYDAEMASRVAKLIRKEGIKRDHEAQLLEDVAALVFLEHYLADFAAAHRDYDEPKLLDILRKTLRKMSAAGRNAASSLIHAPPAVVPLLKKAGKRET